MAENNIIEVKVAPSGKRGALQFHRLRQAVVLGENGVCPANQKYAQKREGDGKTPLGIYPLRYVFYRPDKVAKPKTALMCQALEPHWGWCDDPKDKAYNQRVVLPYAASAERLWRTDGLYDLIIVLGFNDDPPQADRGSAIFIHCAAAAPNKKETKGCLALAKNDLLALLALCTPETKINIAI